MLPVRISADMLAEMGVEYVVLGLVPKEDSISVRPMKPVNKRLKAALAAGLKPILCVGEMLWLTRENGITD